MDLTLLPAVATISAPEVIGHLTSLLDLANYGLKLAKSLSSGDSAHKKLVEMFEKNEGIAQAYPRTLSPRLGARHIELVLLAFGQAFKRAWAGWDRYAQPLRAEKWYDCFITGHDEAARQRQITIALSAALSMPELTTAAESSTPALDPMSDFLGSPIGTPFYRRLWDAFTQPIKTIDADFLEPLISLNGVQRHRFERDFCQAVEEALASQTGQELRAAMMGIAKDKVTEFRRLLLRDMANWGRRHVFGNVAHHQGLPAMPLEEMYVEPLAVFKKETAAPVRSLVHRLIREHKIVVVTADFGHGKSLTARHLTRDWAKDFLASSDGISLDRVLPVFVKCAEDLKSGQLELTDLVAKAHKRAADQLGIPIRSKDNACKLPEAEQATIYLLDGLDEVLLSPNEVESLFDKLREEATDKHRMVVFSRPAAIPKREYLKKHDIPTIELQPFADPQIDAWLTRWNRLSMRPPVTITNGDLRSLARTPILLFMIAHSWDEHRAHGPLNRAAIYEQFFRQIAKGKAEQDSDEHKLIREASDELKDRLVVLRLLDSASEPVDAMLWLLARVAWRGHCLEQQDRRLNSYEVQKILRDELKLDNPNIERTVRIGLLVAIQADVHDEEHEILFGHKSFREYLVGRFWLNMIISSSEVPPRDGMRLTCEKLLMDGRLLGDREDKSFDFLVELLGQSSEDKRVAAFRWAQASFDSEDLEGRTLSEDRWYRVREAALSIGSHCLARTGLTISKPLALRSLLASLFFHRYLADIRAPFVNLSGAELWRASIVDADLKEANLSGARLNFANLSGANLSGTNLSRAKLIAAQCVGADLSGADLSGAVLSGAQFIGVNLRGAQFTGAQLVGINLEGTDMTGVIGFCPPMSDLATSGAEPGASPSSGDQSSTIDMLDDA
ncbi:MAG: pentapeptide repeat-containing protein [Myxococcales bacterium]|nr:pentapeptide repeat-containing protein [Myxococcales bacterium]